MYSNTNARRTNSSVPRTNTNANGWNDIKQQAGDKLVEINEALSIIMKLVDDIPNTAKPLIRELENNERNFFDENKNTAISLLDKIGAYLELIYKFKIGQQNMTDIIGETVLSRSIKESFYGPTYIGYTSADTNVLSLVGCQTRLIDALKRAGVECKNEEERARSLEYKFTGFHPNAQGGGKQNKTKVRIGPNGGRYRVTPSGRKAYL